MKTLCVYVYPAPHHNPRAFDYALRFVETYNRFQPGSDHDTLVVLNGQKPNSEMECIFSSLKNLRFLEHDDSGWDIGAFQVAARANPQYELCVFFGTSIYFRNPGWLGRIHDSVKRHGNAIYGAMGNRGQPAAQVWPHIRTTGWWMKTEMMNKYPIRVTHHDKRYEFEHGRTCITEWFKRQGLQAYVVTATGEFLWKDWDNAPYGFHKFDQRHLLFGDRLTEPPFYPLR